MRAADLYNDSALSCLSRQSPKGGGGKSFGERMRLVSLAHTDVGRCLVERCFGGAPGTPDVNRLPAEPGKADL